MSPLLICDSCLLILPWRTRILYERSRNLAALCRLLWNRALRALCFKASFRRIRSILRLICDIIRVLRALCLACNLANIRYRLKRCNLAILSARTLLCRANSRSLCKRLLIRNRSNCIALLLACRDLARLLAARTRCNCRLSRNFRARILLFICCILLVKASFAFLASRSCLRFPSRLKRLVRCAARTAFLLRPLSRLIRLPILLLSFLVFAIRALFRFILLIFLLLALILFLLLRCLAFLERPLTPSERKCLKIESN